MDLQTSQLTHEYGPRRQCCRAAVLVAGEGITPVTQLLQQALPDFGFGTVTLLQQPTQQQLDDSLNNLMALAVEQPWVEAAYVYFTGRGYQWSHDHQQLQLLQVAGDAPHIDPAAAAAAGGDSYDPQPPAVLVAPFESLEVAAKQGQLPLLVAVDAAQSDSCRPTQQQLDGFRDTLRDRESLRSPEAGGFTHRVTAMGCGNEEVVLLWGWLLFKHTFIRVHSSWAAAHAAAVADLAADGYGEVAPCFASDESNTDLFPHGPVPQQHHRMLRLLHDIATAAASAPRANRTLHLLQQLALLLADPDWRPFVLRWGLLTLNAAEGGDSSGSRAAAAAAGAETMAGAGDSAAPEELDALMRQMAALLAPEVRLPGALLVLAAADRPETRAAAAAILRQLQPLTDYGVLPGEVPGKPDAERRQELGTHLLAVQLAGSGGVGPEGEQQQPLCLVPFVAGFLTSQGLGQELQAAAAGLKMLPVLSPGAGDTSGAEEPPAKRQRTDSTSKNTTAWHLATPPAGLGPRLGLAPTGAAGPNLGLYPGPNPGPFNPAGLPPNTNPALMPNPMLLLNNPALLNMHMAQLLSSAGGPRMGVGPLPGSLGAPALPGAAMPGSVTAPPTTVRGRRRRATLPPPAPRLGSLQQHSTPSGGAQQLPATPQQQQQQQGQQEQEQEMRLNGVIGVGSASIPHTVQHLRALDVSVVTTLLQLPQLTKLTLSQCSSSTQALLQLTAVTGLRELCLSFEKPTDAAASAAAWSRLPVASIFLGGGGKKKFARYASMAVMQGLCQLRQLTELSFYCRMPTLHAAELATTLAPLTSLRGLAMDSLVLDNTNAVAAATGWQQLLASIAGLPLLQRLNVAWLAHGNPAAGGAMGELAACRSSSLTCLRLSYCGINAETATSIVSNPNLRGLRHLDLSTGSMGETSANDATMAAIAANLTALSGLRVGGTKVTEAGKQLVMAACPGVKIY